MRRQCNRTGIAQEQRRLQLLLEFLDLHGNGGRRSEHHFSGGGEISRFRNGDEGSQYVVIQQRQRLAESHGHGTHLQIF
ncbi:hypothetical protein D3C72_1585530 [compost metagenome]